MNLLRFENEGGKMKSEKITDAIAIAYEHYLMRDLVYVSSGALLIITIYYAIEGEVMIKEFLNDITQNIFRFLLFLFFSYFFGLIAQESCRKIKYKKSKLIEMRPYEKEKGEYDMLMPMIHKEFGVYAIRRIERTIFVKTVGSAFCSAAFVFFVLLVIIIPISVLSNLPFYIIQSVTPTSILILVSMFLLVVFGRFQNLKMLEVQNNSLKKYKKYFDEKNNQRN